MNPNHRVADVDGYGDRSDIALERDRAQGEIYENRKQAESDLHYRLIDAFLPS